MNLSAEAVTSLLARLRDLSKRYLNVPKFAMLLLYAQQGFLGRLEASRYGERFVLKGALSLFARYGDLARPTEDVDLAARDLPNTTEAVANLMREVSLLGKVDSRMLTSLEGIRTRQD
jgi:predicted nucleotidyltransferase component of viral defense system